jgi:tRNA-dihydrouridine synthase A
MAEPMLVADCVKAMRDAVSLPVTVKHRIGIDKVESYEFMRDFVGTLAEAGCEVFSVHARNAWLKGLSPKENREIPPLRHEAVYRLKRDFPSLTICLNGGVTNNDQIAEHLKHVDGVMVGREAYHHPWMQVEWDQRFSHDQPSEPDEFNTRSRMQSSTPKTRAEVEAVMVAYMERHVAAGGSWPQVARHMMGLWNGLPGARRWRQVLSDHKLKTLPPAEVMRMATDAREQVPA